MHLERSESKKEDKRKRLQTFSIKHQLDAAQQKWARFLSLCRKCLAANSTSCGRRESLQQHKQQHLGLGWLPRSPVRRSEEAAEPGKAAQSSVRLAGVWGTAQQDTAAPGQAHAVVTGVSPQPLSIFLPIAVQYFGHRPFPSGQTPKNTPGGGSRWRSYS